MKKDVLEKMWQAIIKFNDVYFPNWRARELILYSNALAGETGELCNAVTKLYGGGTKPLPKGVALINSRIEAVDVFIQLVLFLEAQGLDSEMFEYYFNLKFAKIKERMESRKKS